MRLKSLIFVECEPARIVLSAELDHEAGPEEAEAASVHLASCASCRLWRSNVVVANRLLRLRSAETIPDLTEIVLTKANPVSAGRGEWIRYALAVVALTELVVASRGLIAGLGSSTVHAARHTGSFGSAIAVGLLYVAWRPARAFGFVPIVAALAITMTVAAVIDVASGRTSGLAEAHHVLQVAGLVMVWMLAGRPLPHRPQRSGAQGAQGLSHV